ncbi:MAG: glycosyltransferase [Cyclobacteriaceae bacterium]
MFTNMNLSIIIPIDAYHPVLLSNLESWDNQNFNKADFEVIVVDSEKKTDWVEAIDDLKSRGFNLRYEIIESDHRSVRANFGASQAQAPLLLFFANDFFADETLVSSHVSFHKMHNDKTIGVGTAISVESQREASAFLRWLEDSGQLFGISFTKNVKIPEGYFYMGNCSIKKSFFEQVGGFNEAFAFPCCEDYEFGIRSISSGSVSRLVENAQAIHDHPITFEERARSMEFAGRSAKILEKLNAFVPIEYRPLRESLKRIVWKCQRQINGDDQLQHKVWNSKLAGSFYQGYIDQDA